MGVWNTREMAVPRGAEGALRGAGYWNPSQPLVGRSPEAKADDVSCHDPVSARLLESMLVLLTIPNDIRRVRWVVCENSFSSFGTGPLIELCTS